MAEYKFPTEVVDLPSKGHFYVDGHPLSSGKVEVKYMTAKEEDMLTSRTLLKNGVAIERVIQIPDHKRKSASIIIIGNEKINKNLFSNY